MILRLVYIAITLLSLMFISSGYSLAHGIQSTQNTAIAKQESSVNHSSKTIEAKDLEMDDFQIFECSTVVCDIDVEMHLAMFWRGQKLAPEVHNFIASLHESPEPPPPRYLN